MVWFEVLLLMLHFVSDFEKVLSHKVHLESHRVYVESTGSLPGVHLESMWSLHGVHMESTGSPQGIWDSRWSPPQPVGECHLQSQDPYYLYVWKKTCFSCSNTHNIYVIGHYS